MRVIGLLAIAVHVITVPHKNNPQLHPQVLGGSSDHPTDHPTDRGLSHISMASKSGGCAYGYSPVGMRGMILYVVKPVLSIVKPS